MVNRLWSLEEERVFWKTIIPKSPKRIGIHRANPGLSWADCASEMLAIFNSNARRNYTPLSLFEHWFQNAVKQRFSPNAHGFVSEYLNNCQPSDLNSRKRPAENNKAANTKATSRGRRKGKETKSTITTGKNKPRVTTQGTATPMDTSVENPDQASCSDSVTITNVSSGRTLVASEDYNQHHQLPTARPEAPLGVKAGVYPPTPFLGHSEPQYAASKAADSNAVDSTAVDSCCQDTLFVSQSSVCAA